MRHPASGGTKARSVSRSARQSCSGPPLPQSSQAAVELAALRFFYHRAVVNVALLDLDAKIARREAEVALTPTGTGAASTPARARSCLAFF